MRDGMEEFGDKIRWVPTEHMLADALTKRMPPDLFLHYMKDNRYSFKFDPILTHVKIDARNRRRELRQEKKAEKATRLANFPKDLIWI